VDGGAQLVGEGILGFLGTRVPALLANGGAQLPHPSAELAAEQEP
jgi:hypothetical protein